MFAPAWASACFQPPALIHVIPSQSHLLAWAAVHDAHAHNLGGVPALSGEHVIGTSGVSGPGPEGMQVDGGWRQSQMLQQSLGGE